LKRKNILALILLLQVLYIGNAQNIQGRIADIETKEGIPYATIELKSRTGTISNEEGSFTLVLPEGRKDTIVVSSMGYRQKRIPYETIGQEMVIYLEPSVIELEEVLLQNRMPTAEDIIREVKAAYSKNYSNSGQKYQMFYRGTSYMHFENLDVSIEKASSISRNKVAKASERLDSLAKAIMNSRIMEFRDYSGFVLLKDKDSSKVAVDKATKLIDSKKDFSMENVQKKAQQIILQYLDTTLTYKLKTGLFKIEDSLALKQENFVPEKKDVFSKREVKSSVMNALKTSQLYEFSFLDKILSVDSYRFTLVGASYFQGQPIYIVTFRPRKAKSKFTGAFYISAADYGILKADYSFSEGKEGKKFNMKLLLGIKYLENRNTGTIIYKVGEGGKYHPYYIKREFGNYVYLHRPLKFVENTKARNKVLFDFTMEGQGREKKELLILSGNALKQEEFENFKEEDDIPYTLLRQFEPSIWQNSQIIEPLQEMKSFKADN
jgi:hypothetical protein